ncbi:MAG TPA: YdcH family protein [Candidatus Angelobacter sp.]|nr:YdcH family protein [Candidatus Angelobacter sp.]
MVDSVREQLLASHEQFRRLAQEHSHYSQRIETLSEKKYLSEDEKVEEVRLKKLKLNIKDQMESIEQLFRRNQSQVA